ncbi:FkbM family methyltransferase [Pseudomonadota bacterium]
MKKLSLLKKIRNSLSPTYRAIQKLDKKFNTILEKQGLLNLKNNHVSYSQAGEDKVIEFVLDRWFHKNHPITYIDIGCNDPIDHNNSYYFYQNNGKGVLIEANPDLLGVIKKQRPNDISLNAGVVRKTNKKGMVFYKTDAPCLNTFDPNRIKEMKKHGHKVIEEIRVAVFSLTDIIEKYLNKKVPDFISVDVEGLELDILKGINLSRYRPLLFVVEANWKTFEYGEKHSIVDYLLKKDYIVVANTAANIIFADKKKFDFNVVD